MEAILEFIQRKQKLHKTAVGDHLITLHEALDGETKQRLHQLSQRSITITVPPDCPTATASVAASSDPDEGQDDETSTSTRTSKLFGFKVANLPDSRLDERIILIRMDTATQQEVAKGSIVGVGENEVKIRLDTPIEVTYTELENNSDAEGGSGGVGSSCVFKIKLDKQDIVNRRARIAAALWRFEHVSCSMALHKCLLGNYKDLSNNKFKKSRAISLNETSLRLKGAQLKAVEQSMRKRVSLIEGVAGSGKSLVAASLAYSMCRFRAKKILLCSPIQATVDKLAQLLKNATNFEVRVVKLGGSTTTRSSRDNCKKEFSGEDDDHDHEEECCELESLVRAELYKDSWQRFERSSTTGRQPLRGTPVQRAQQFHRQAMRSVAKCSSWRRRKVERKILRKADIVCCTLLQAGNPCLRGQNFDMLIIDDLQAAPETDCMVAMMVKGLKQMTLISEMRREIRSARSKGGHLQVGAVAKPEAANGRAVSLHRTNNKKAILRAAVDKDFMKNRDLAVKQAQEPGGLFERLLSMGLSAIVLRTQFRMHETLAAFSNHHFYLSRLKTDKKTNEELTKQICNSSEDSKEKLDNYHKFNWLPNSSYMTAFFNTSDSTTTTTGRSTIDQTVVDIINKLVSKGEGVPKSSIGIIINRHSHDAIKSNFNGIDIGTVEYFLGQERDFIILMAKRGDNDNGDDNITANGFEKRDSEKYTTTTATTVRDCNYLRDDNSLLTALTRARWGLFIVANMPMDDFSIDCQTQTSGVQLVKDSVPADQLEPEINQPIGGEIDATSGEKPKDTIVSVTLKSGPGIIELDQDKSKWNHYYCESWKAMVRYYIANKIVVQAQQPELGH